MEAVQWVPDAALAGKLFDDNTGAAYDPADYAGHGSGLFFVAVEDNGHVYAFALAADGGATLVSEIAPGLTGVMALDYDSVRDVLWAVCDDGCQGRSAEITLNGTAKPGLAHHARPAGMPDINNEGFATAPASLSVDGQRPVWWFADGFASQSLRTGTLPGGDDETPGTKPPLPGSALNDDNRNGVTINPSAAAAGQQVVVTVGDAQAGTEIAVWMYSDPQRLASGVLDASGRITVTIPADAAAGAHRIAVYDAEGDLIGWGDLQVTAASGGATDGGAGAGDGGLANTGGALPVAATVLALLLLSAGGVMLARRRRTA
jgi:LPXTG-motif cell wall-anchored protein